MGILSKLFGGSDDGQAQTKNEAWIIDSIPDQSQREQRQEEASRIVELPPVCCKCLSAHVQHGHCFSCGYDTELYHPTSS